jgi:glycerophosphoryl diester phosphodiesterase
VSAGAAPLILGHRGAPRAAPENTIAGFTLALDAGADGVEMDVQLSADGVPVVIHDDTLRRTTGARGRVDRLSWRRISELRTGGEPVPSLEQAGAWAAATGAWLNVEIKAMGAAAATLAVLEEAGIAERVIVSSFHVSVVEQVGRLDPHAARYLLLERWDAAARTALETSGAGGVCLRVDVATDAVLAELEPCGLPVVVWTVDDPRRLRELLGSSVRAVITNRPELAARLRG